MAAEARARVRSRLEKPDRRSIERRAAPRRSCRAIRSRTATPSSSFAPARAATRPALFAADLHRMYTRFCERQGWRVETMSLVRSHARGGIREVIFKVSGDSAYGCDALGVRRAPRPARCRGPSQGPHPHVGGDGGRAAGGGRGGREDRGQGHPASTCSARRDPAGRA